MANTKVDTGHGASITFGTSSYSFNWKSIAVGGRNRPAVDITHLGASSELFMAGDLQSVEDTVIGFLFDPHTSAPATTTTAETVTVTWPVAAGGSVAATYAGTGLITSVKLPTMQTNTVQEGEITVKWTGATGPTFTAGS